jgi:hypothetical protein
VPQPGARRTVGLWATVVWIKDKLHRHQVMELHPFTHIYKESDMESLISTPAATTGMIAAMIFFLTALLTGSWKYFCIRNSATAEAPVYVNIAHRAALMYSFAALLLAVFASLSAFSDTVNMVAICLPLFYFALAIVRYIFLGITNTTNNQHLNPPSRTGELVLLSSLIVAETGGFLVLATGFMLRVLQS